MPEDFREFIEPIGASAPLDRVRRGSGMPPVPPGHGTIRGKIHAVRRGQAHKEGHHRLDVSVGADDETEIIIRVPNGAYTGLEGKRVTLHIEE